MRPVQYFSTEYLARCREMTPGQIAKFLEDFRLMGVSAPPSKSRLISLKVPENLLAAFKSKAGKAGTPYQTQIKRLMTDWLLTQGGDEISFSRSSEKQVI